MRSLPRAMKVPAPGLNPLRWLGRSVVLRGMNPTGKSGTNLNGPRCNLKEHSKQGVQLVLRGGSLLVFL